MGEIYSRLGLDILQFGKSVREDLRNMPYPEGYVVSQRWRVILNDAIDKAVRVESLLGLIRIGLEMFDLQHEAMTEERAGYLRGLRAEYVARNPELSVASETAFLPEEAVANIDGVRFSEKMRQIFDYYEEIKLGVGQMSGIRVIVEVGSGYGRLARLMLQLDGYRCYVFVDIPESLVFAYAFIRSSFPEARVKIVARASDIEPGMTKRFNIIFCPIQRLADLKLGRVDLFINTYSFAEMTQGSVDHILDCVAQVLKPRFLYSLNLVFTDKTIHFDTGGLDGEGNETVLSLRPEWWPNRFDLRPDFLSGKCRVTGSVVLQHVRTPVPALIIELRKAAQECVGNLQMRLGYLYLAALWSRDPDLAAKFLLELRRFFSEFGFTPTQADFDKIGEVVVLRRAMEKK